MGKPHALSLAGHRVGLPSRAVDGAPAVIGVVVVTFDSPCELLARCLRSVESSVSSTVGTGIDVRDVVVVDNASQLRPALVGRARLLPRKSNDGFAAAVNAGISALDPDCTLVLLLNPDAALEPEALSRCANALQRADRWTVAVAPKMVLAAERADGPLRTIDAIGIGVNGRAEAANRGLGQPDIGQYDEPEVVFGACFGAALIRRGAFDECVVGPLDERLFLYYEDVAWCWTAQLLGYRIVTEPSAVVTHVMSAGVVRERPYAFKFFYTERNLLLCALMFFSPGKAFRVVTRRSLGLLRGSILGNHYPLAGLKALVGTVFLLPHTLAVRRRVTSRRQRSDADIVAYRADEPIFFDSVRYTVSDPNAALAFAQRRLDRQHAQRVGQNNE